MYLPVRGDADGAVRSNGRTQPSSRAPLIVHVTTVSNSLRFLLGQAAFMGERGFRVAVVTSPGAFVDAFQQSERIPVHLINLHRKISPLRDIIAVWRMTKHFRSLRPTIVHAHTPKGGLLALIAAALTRAPIRIYHVRGLPFVTATGARRKLLRWTEWLSCRLANRVICVSFSVRELLVSSNLCSETKAKVLLKGSGNGVDAEKRFDPESYRAAREHVRHDLGIASDAIVIGFVGRLVRDKGIVDLAMAWRELRDLDERLHLLVIGTVDVRDPVPEQILASLRSDPKVHLVGRQNEIPKYYSSMDIFVLPTYREGFPNVSAEASAMALPVVSTDAVGARDAVRDGETGAVVSLGDHSGLVRALLEYAHDPALRANHGQQGREWMLHDFKPIAIWNALADEYESLLSLQPKVL